MVVRNSVSGVAFPAPGDFFVYASPIELFNVEHKDHSMNASMACPFHSSSSESFSSASNTEKLLS